MRAAYNVQLATKDPGAFAHNAKYVIELLSDSIADVNTALDARYLYDGVTQRLLGITDSKANAALSSGLGGAFTADMRLVTVNATQYGGAGGTYAVYAGGNDFANFASGGIRGMIGVQQ